MRKSATPLDHNKLSLLLTALNEKEQRENKSFVLMPAARKVLENIQQVTEMDLETMLMDILDNETTLGLRGEELLGTCEAVSATVQENQVPTTAIPHKDFVNGTSLTETADVINRTAMEVDTVPPVTICKITTGRTTYFDI